jgi:hypothetical protein
MTQAKVCLFNYFRPMETNYALCSNKECPNRLMCLRYFLFKSEMYDATDDVVEFEPDDEGECEHFLPFLQENEMDNTNEE